MCEVIKEQLLKEQKGKDKQVGLVYLARFGYRIQPLLTMVAILQLKIEILHMDSFYKNLSKEQEQTIEDYNFDHPDAFDFNTISSALEGLKRGDSVHIPDYDFKNHRR